MQLQELLQDYNLNLSLGNLDAKRDWGYAQEYCEGMWKILQYKNAEDFVLATGQTNTVKEFVELTFNNLGVELEWKGKGVNEKGVIKNINFDKAKSLINFSKNSKLYKYDFTTKLKKGDTVVTVNPGLLSSNRSRFANWRSSKSEKTFRLESRNKI